MSFQTMPFIGESPRVPLSSFVENLRKNADGSTDIYFGPTAPDGGEPNWIPTKAGDRYLLLFRFYKPGKEVADKTWQLPDVVRTN